MSIYRFSGFESEDMPKSALDSLGKRSALITDNNITAPISGPRLHNPTGVRAGEVRKTVDRSDRGDTLEKT